MKFSIFTVSAPEYSIDECLDKLKEFGYDGVEFRVYDTPEEVKNSDPSYWSYNKCTVELKTIEEDASDLLSKCSERGLEICALATYLTVGQAEEIERVLKAAKAMNCPRIRVNAPGYNKKKNYNDILENAIKDIKVLESLSKKYGIKINLEMHMGNIIPSASAAYRLVSSFDPKNIGIIYDVGNMVHEGYEEYKMGLEILGEYLDHIHIKNAKSSIKETLDDGTDIWNVQWSSLKSGQVNFRKFFNAVREFGYDGYLSFEDFSGDEDTEGKLRSNINYIKSLL